MIHIACPQLDDREIHAVREVLESGMLAQGKKVRSFEEAFADYVGAKYAVAVGNGTQALHLALIAYGIGPGDTVLTTPFTFISTATAIRMAGADVQFLDVDKRTYNIESLAIERVAHADKERRIKAVIPVHLYGRPTYADHLREGTRPDIKIIYDASQAHGAGASLFASGPIALWGDCSCWSFYATKNITTGEGGMITLNDPDVAEHLRRLRNHGQTDRYEYSDLGYNYRMTDIQAAIGLVQLRKLPQMLLCREGTATIYNQTLRDDGAIIKPEVGFGILHAWHQYTIRVPVGRDALKEYLASKGIFTRVYYPRPLHKTSVFASHNTESFPVAEMLAEQVLSLPIHAGVTRADAIEIANAVNSWECP